MGGPKLDDYKNVLKLNGPQTEQSRNLTVLTPDSLESGRF